MTCALSAGVKILHAAKPNLYTEHIRSISNCQFSMLHSSNETQPEASATGVPTNSSQQPGVSATGQFLRLLPTAEDRWRVVDFISKMRETDSEYKEKRLAISRELVGLVGYLIVQLHGFDNREWETLLQALEKSMDDHKQAITEIEAEYRAQEARLNNPDAEQFSDFQRKVAELELKLPLQQRQILHANLKLSPENHGKVEQCVDDMMRNIQLLEHSRREVEDRLHYQPSSNDVQVVAELNEALWLRVPTENGRENIRLNFKTNVFTSNVIDEDQGRGMINMWNND